MRSALKGDILKMTETLSQAHGVIRDNIALKKYMSAQDMLGQCQESAISIGTAIEQSEGEGFITVSYLEEYCEALYHIHTEIEQQKEINDKQIYKLLKKHIVTIENSVRHDIPVRKELAFLPYKASMWDSLESVWKAADEDPECDAYVVPIPYYDKNPDGSFKSEHYEGEDFPEYVPITHYQDYDLAYRRPEAIFIHNPYDQYNYVTSVHPFFYSDKLKEYTEKLIYIPYYVSTEISDPYNREIMKDREGFVLSNGVLNSDMVVVQSANTKTLYVNILEENIPGIARSYWEQKIWGLGSPKLERIHSVQRDDTRLSENWRKIIYTADGMRKKVVLYNVSVSTLLNVPEILSKIKDTLEFFKENTNIALWWRPHPLYESTLASMRSGLLEEYREIVGRYKKEAWGIFDAGEDLAWAIAETDAYYGDGSSVIHLYREAQKPIMVQNAFVKTTEDIRAEDLPVWPSAFYVDRDDIWFVHGKMNVLMKYNTHEKRTYVLGRIPNEKIAQSSGYIGIYQWKDKLFLIPSWARELAVFDITEEKFKKISLNHMERYNGKGLFTKIYANGKHLYCIPFWYESIVKIDMECEEIQYIETTYTGHRYINQAVRIENMVFAVYSCTNQILCLNMDSDLAEVQMVGEPSHEFVGIGRMGNELYAFDMVSKSLFKIYGEHYRETSEFYKTPYDSALLFNVASDLMLIDPVDDNELLVINKDGEVDCRIESEQQIHKSPLYSTYFCGIDGDTSNNQEFFYASWNLGVIYHFINAKLEKRFSMRLEDKEYEKLKNMYSHMEMLESDETEMYYLKDWIEGIKEYVNDNEKLHSGCGQRILQTVKEILQ